MEIALDQHKFDNAVVMCSDGRFSVPVVSQLNIYPLDVLAIPGASLKVLRDPSVMADIELLTELHGIQVWHLVDHIDCGYFRKELGEDSEKLHLDNLRKAKELIESRLPNVSVATWFARVTSDNQLELKPVSFK
ncbi:MAG: carbonic anhydrase [Patescibacteria group bacterium]